MRLLKLSLAAIAAALLVFGHKAPARAVTPSPIAPGDVIFTEFFDGWHKLDPTTGQVTLLPWPTSSIFTAHIAFDLDGAVLFDDTDGIKRLHPLTGGVASLNIGGLSQTDGFVVESNGDLLVANSHEVSRFSRSTLTTSTVTGGTFFSPNGIARGAGGRVFVTEFFEDLWEVNPATGTRSEVTSFDLSIPGLIAVRSDGDLIVQNFSPGVLYRINPNTGAVSLFTSDLPSAVSGIAIDANDNLWLSSNDGIFRYPSDGGAKTLIAEDSFFSPHAIAIVPLNWSPPAIPEPRSAVTALIAVVGVAGPAASRFRRAWS